MKRTENISLNLKCFFAYVPTKNSQTMGNQLAFAFNIEKYNIMIRTKLYS